MSEVASARFFLREKTADLHAALDDVLSKTDFDDRSSYAEFLTRQSAPLFAIERALDAALLGPALPDLADRRRSDAIAQDLARLGVSHPAPLRPLHFSERDAAFGALYVLEGSRLGAKFLVKQANASRDPDVRAATAYLSHGEGKPFWPTFLIALGQIEAHGLDRHSLLDGAREAFTLFLDAARDTRPAVVE